MNSKEILILEKINYRHVSLGEASCIHCNNSNDNLNVSDNGIIESKCCYLNMIVDELHICDLIL
ncbi:hypothetical protein [Methanobacterium sp.]|uniref:hypothetical protein n=1 Tax=Methanobacterium sp. TaxID=2164 RepID=UPI003C71F8B9